MLPKINGKDLLDCFESDFESILENLDYRENEYIDYKEDMTILRIPKEKRQEKQREIAELRSDVCAFANANGGYLIFGIAEDSKGVPKELVGISIPDDNTDKLELDIKNWLQPINPHCPSYKIHFINLSNNQYLVVLYIRHDYFVPYIHLVDQKDYRIYKRSGNSKVTIQYTELRNMFSQTMSLEKEVEQFRKKRIEYFTSQEDTDDHKYSKFMMLHIIPETFMDSSYNMPVYVLYRSKKCFLGLFQSFNCTFQSFPMIEGVRFTSYRSNEECRLYNNGIAECFYPLFAEMEPNNTYPNGYIPRTDIILMVEDTIKKYIEFFCDLLDSTRVFVGISIIGCTGALTETSYGSYGNSTVDRNHLFCNPIVFNNIHDDKMTNRDLKLLKLDFLLSLGVRTNSEINDLIHELYE